MPNGATSADDRVSRADVVWCYRNILNREPESENVIRVHLRCPSFRDLVKGFIASGEFKKKRGPRPRPFHPFPPPAQHIDVELSRDQMAMALLKVKETWSHLGDEKPHFSVLTRDEYLPKNLDNSINEFWASGDRAALGVARMFEAAGMTTAGKLCVEYGCGVGRVTRGLARQFGRVVAYDISANHIKVAAEQVAHEGIENIVFTVISEPVIPSLEPCDAFYSVIVFQHNPPPIIHGLVKSMLKALKPGGVAIFQVPVYRPGYEFNANKWLNSANTLKMEMHCLPQRYIFEAIANSGCVTVQVHEDGRAGPAFISNVFTVRKSVVDRA